MESGCNYYVISLFSANGIANAGIYKENMFTETKSSVLIGAVTTKGLFV
jgi:hypothetical protein